MCEVWPSGAYWRCLHRKAAPIRASTAQSSGNGGRLWKISIRRDEILWHYNHFKFDRRLHQSARHISFWNWKLYVRSTTWFRLIFSSIWTNVIYSAICYMIDIESWVEISITLWSALPLLMARQHLQAQSLPSIIHARGHHLKGWIAWASMWWLKPWKRLPLCRRGIRYHLWCVTPSLIGWVQT